MIFNVGGTDQSTGQKYRIEFKHLNRASKYGSKRLWRVTGFRAMTTCVIVTGDVVAIEHVFCSELDNFSKEKGRIKALSGALHCPRIPREHVAEILRMYYERSRGVEVKYPGVVTQVVTADLKPHIPEAEAALFRPEQTP